MSITLHPFVNENDFWNAALKATLKAIEEALEQHGHVRIGLAGGSTPKKLYELLAHQNLPWQKFTWILIDERYVPIEDTESNLRMLRRTLFDPAQIPHEGQVFFETDLPALEATEVMSKKLQALEKMRTPLFDLLILGAGKDGHIASLFEGDSELFTSRHTYISEAPTPYETTQRLTLSLRALSHSKQVLLLLKGEEKRPVLESLEGRSVLPLTALKSLTSKVPTQVLFCL